ncbi:MAG: kelch repeat-containing protein, partial [Thermoplasmata archaeon]|nr:kelch repeat-containing protein [Thermoplasmata archaeon]
MAPYRPADGRGLFDLGKRGRAIAPVLVLLLMVLDGLPAAGAAHASPPTVAVGGTVASPIVTHLPSPAVSNGASSLCRTSAGCASTPAAPHPAVAPPPRWTDLQSKVTNQVPAHRYLGSMAYDPLDGYVVLFGGFGNGSSTPYSDTWSYSNGRWNEISTSGPPARYAAMMAWDAADNYILLFGGYDSSTGTIYNDTWSFVHGTWNQLNPTTEPPARWRGAMAFDIADNYTVLFGGTPDTGTLSPLKDTWTFNAGVWTDQSGKVSGNPAAKFRQEMAYDAADGYAVMFGGCTASGCTGTDTWTYSNLTWKQLSLVTKPTARAYEGITYDAAQGYVLM